MAISGCICEMQDGFRNYLYPGLHQQTERTYKAARGKNLCIFMICRQPADK